MAITIQKILLFGASGSIGSALREKFSEKSWQVIGISRGASSDKNQIRWNPLIESSD